MDFSRSENDERMAYYYYYMNYLNSFVNASSLDPYSRNLYSSYQHWRPFLEHLNRGAQLEQLNRTLCESERQRSATPLTVREVSNTVGPTTSTEPSNIAGSSTSSEFFQRRWISSTSQGNYFSDLRIFNQISNRGRHQNSEPYNPTDILNSSLLAGGNPSFHLLNSFAVRAQSEIQDSTQQNPGEPPNAVGATLAADSNRKLPAEGNGSSAFKILNDFADRAQNRFQNFEQKIKEVDKKSHVTKDVTKEACRQLIPVIEIGSPDEEIETCQADLKCGPNFSGLSKRCGSDLAVSESRQGHAILPATFKLSNKSWESKEYTENLSSKEKKSKKRRSSTRQNRPSGEQELSMPKEWTGPSEYFAAGLYGNQNRKAIFRSILTQEGQSRGFNAMEFEEAADLSIKKSKHGGYEKREKIYPSPYGLDETMDLSTKWRAPPTSERKSLSSISSHLAHAAAASTSNTSETHSSAPERTSEHKRSKSSHHVRMLPRKRLHTAPAEQPAQPPQPNSASSCSTSPDVIVLSDEDRPRLNGHVNGYESDSKYSDSEPLEMPPLPEEKKWDPEELKEKQRLWKELQDELRSEEMKLVLLKKLHQSQLMKENLLNQAAAVAGKMVPIPSKGASSAAPPPLVRSGQIPQPQNKMLSQQLSHSSSSMLNSPLQLCNQNTHGGPPPLVGQRGYNSSGSSSLSSNIMGSMMRSSNHSSSSRAPVTTPPNMVMGYNLHNLQQSVQSSQHQISNTQANPQACPSPSSTIQSSQMDRMDNQTPAQRQAAAKLALRKQLEKTLLQIPPPKPPPPEMHFVPNANNQEFICLLGLEKVVDLITDDPNNNRPAPEPFECVQCGTDFSPVWKWQDAGRTHRMHKPSVICENCVTTNIKKALKAEHTNRLKTAFVKALQQEQEIEQRMSSQNMTSPPPMITSPTHTPSSTPTPVNVTTGGSSIPTPPAPHSPVHSLMSKMVSSSVGGNSSHSAAAALVNSQSLLQHLPKLSAAHQSLLHAQAQQLQHFAAQTMPQPQPAHMYPFAPLLAAQAYSYQLLGKNPMSSAELQRQYLLDMIPPRSLPQGSINWKT